MTTMQMIEFKSVCIGLGIGYLPMTLERKAVEPGYADMSYTVSVRDRFIHIIDIVRNMDGKTYKYFIYINGEKLKYFGDLTLLKFTRKCDAINIAGKIVELYNDFIYRKYLNDYTKKDRFEQLEDYKLWRNETYKGKKYFAISGFYMYQECNRLKASKKS